MLAYSTVAHSGYVLLGVIAASPQGMSSSIFYMFSYILMSLAAFGLIVVLSAKGREIEQIDDLRGLNARHPWLAFLMLLVMFSMAGVPPLLGFFAKLTVLMSLVQAHMVWLATVALLFSIVGAYYYIRVVRVMYFEKPEDSAPIQTTFDGRLLFSINALALLLLGLLPSGLLHLSQTLLR